MAVLCAKCGAEVSPGAQFCAACGTPVAQAAAPASSGFTPVNIPVIPVQAAAPSQPVASSPPLTGYTPVAAAPPPAYIPPPPPPGGVVQTSSGGGGGAIKIILIVLAIVIGLGILGAGAVGFFVWRVAHSFHVNGKNGQVTINTPGGNVSTSSATSFTSDELGTDIYPGAQATAGGMRMNLPSGSVISGVFTTSDSKDQVLSFYKSKFGSEASVFDADDSAMVTAKKGDHESVMVTISAKPSENEGKTKISIVHTRTNRPS